MTASFLFYDLETFGADPRHSRIAQFAAIRTDADLNEVEAPVDFMVRPANDVLPSPTATVITGILPQRARRDGIREADAFARIAEEMGRANTCSVGYNSLRFDDEFVRHGLYRNFHDPYEREWRGGNSRWDVLDALRLMHALRPEGITWRPREDGGGTSFKLEHLAEDNGLRIGMAHEALSDVRATIGLARLFKAAQPRLWDYSLRLRDKRHAASLLDVAAMTPVLHVSQRFPASRLCAAPVVPLARHPQIDSQVIVFDLADDPQALLDLPAEAIAARLYVRQADLAEGETRIALKTVHLNRSPALVPWVHLRTADFDRLAIDPGVVETRLARLRAAGPALAEKVRRVFGREHAGGDVDVDAALYGGFVGDGDKRLCAQVRGTPPALLAKARFAFRDPRMPELLFRYRARNWPEQLLPTERERWDAYRRHRLGDASSPGLCGQDFASFKAELGQLRASGTLDAGRAALLTALESWAGEIAGELA